MLLRTRGCRLHIGATTGAGQAVNAARATPRSRQGRGRQFSELASSYRRAGQRGLSHGSTAEAQHARTSASVFPPMGSSTLGRALHSHREAAFHGASGDGGGGAATPDKDGFVSQRQRHRRTHAGSETDGYDAAEDGGAVAGSRLSPLPKKYGFYDGIDEHALETQTLSRDARRERLRQALEASAASVVELTDASEADMDLGGLPASEYHGQDGWTTVSTQSSLYNNILARDALESRQRSNTWTTARRHSQRAVVPTGSSHEDEAGVDENGDGVVLDAARRLHRRDDGEYSEMVEGELLAPVQESIGQPRSVYAMRKLFVQGLVGYQGIISRAEESAIAGELLTVLQDPRAAYVAEEARYCVNLYERELGIPGKDTLAFAMARAPTLQRVLSRFFYLGVIPSLPNVCQISEMTGTFSGYPVHRKPSSIGSYFGILNLVSTSVLYMQHVDCPWYPRVHMTPRSLFVFTDPCLSEYKTGYKWTHQPFHAFDYATRVSKDYRIEVMFATVEVEHQKHLHESVQLTDYATEKAAAATSAPGATAVTEPRASTDEWLSGLRERLHRAEKGSVTVATDDPSHGAAVGGEAEAALPLDGHKLREALRARKLVGHHAQGFDLRVTPPSDTARATAPSAAPTAAQRRLSALKNRHAEAEARHQRQAQGRQLDTGPRLIRGHAPADDAGKL